MLPPSWLSWALIAAKAIEDASAELAGQLALADFIVRGEFERHLRRMRLRYGQRRETLMAPLAREFPDWRLQQVQWDQPVQRVHKGHPAPQGQSAPAVQLDQRVRPERRGRLVRKVLPVSVALSTYQLGPVVV